jgi:hypothetical protein
MDKEKSILSNQWIIGDIGVLGNSVRKELNGNKH